MEQITLRRCAASDAFALALIGQSTFLDTFAGVLSGRDILGHCQTQHAIEKYRSWLGDGRTQIWLAEAQPGAAPVGYLVLTTPDLPLNDLSSGDLEVKRVYLLRRFQRGGTGKRLMAEARSFAEAAGARRLLLGVYSENRDAISFYKKLGYVQVGERSFNVGHSTYHDFILALPLDGTG